MSYDWPKHGLGRLDGDSLTLVCELLAPRPEYYNPNAYGLRPLSMTCKWLRSICMPVLFRSCIVRSSGLDREGARDPVFIPPSLWGHVQIITFLDEFTRADMVIYIDHERRRLLMPDDIKFLEEIRTRSITSARPVGEYLRNALQLMPRLHTINIHMCRNVRDVPWLITPRAPLGVSMYLLSAMLSVPQLRYLNVQGMLCHPYDEPLPAHTLSPPSIPLESLVYNVGHNGPSHQVTGLELSVVSLLLERASATLRILELPSQSTPLHRMHLWTWPMLTKLSLHGERPLYEDGPPLVVALGQMPRLRELSLRLAEPATTALFPPPIWPSYLKGSYEWPELEQVCISPPNPDDEFYVHLPASLQSLSLRCWPRHYKLGPEMGFLKPQICANWSSTLCCSSEMLHMLRGVDAPRLTTLDIEYLMDAHDELLLRHLPSFYPDLKVLRILRYRPTTESDIHTEQIADCLRGLTNLRLLMIYMDFNYLPLRERGYLSDPHMRGYADSNDALWVETAYKQYAERLFAALAQEATALAHALPMTLEHICFLIPLRRRTIQWYPYRIVREEGEGSQKAEGRFHVSQWRQSHVHGVYESLYGFE